MGTIKNQSLRQSLVSFAGIGVGIINVLFIYPRMAKADFGLMQFFLNSALFFSSFLLMGLHVVSIQYYSLVKHDKEMKKEFLFFLMFSTLFSSALYGLVLYFFRGSIAHVFFNGNVDAFIDFWIYIWMLSVLMALSMLLLYYTSNFGKTAIPNLFLTFFPKVFQSILVLVFISGIISLSGLINGLMSSYFLIFILLAAYLYKLGEFSFKPAFKFLDWELSKSIAQYSFSISLIGISTSIAFQLDSLLITSMLGFESLSVYWIARLILETIDAPRKSISSISIPIIAEAMKNEDYTKVSEIYKKAGTILLAVGVFLLGGILVCIDDLYLIMPNGQSFSSGKTIIIILGLAKLVDLATSVNSEIIMYSKFYKYQLAIFLIMACVNILGNVILTPLLGLNGVALATLFTFLIFNAIKIYLIFHKMGVHPLNESMIAVISVGALLVFFISWIPSFWGAIVGILLKGGIFSCLYLLFIYYYKVSEDINSVINKQLHKLSNFLSG